MSIVPRKNDDFVALSEVTSEFVAVADLNVETAYQRNIKDSKVQEIVKDFWPTAFGAVIVGRRSSGKLFVVDGQNRLEAARRLNLEAIPATVFPSRGRSHEAGVFMRVNINRTSVHAVEKFRAALAEGAEDAVEIRDTLAEYDFVIARSASWGNIQAVVPVYEAYRDGNLGNLMDTLIGAFEPQDDALRKYACQSVMIGMIAFVHRQWGFGRNNMTNHLDEKKLVKVMRQPTYEQWVSIVKNGKGPARNRAVGAAYCFIDRYYNKGVPRTQRLETRYNPSVDPDDRDG